MSRMAIRPSLPARQQHISCMYVWQVYLARGVRNEDLEYRSFLERPRYNSAVWSVKRRGTHTNVSRVSKKLIIGSCRIWFLSIYFLHAFCLPCTPYKKSEPSGCNDPLKPPIILPSFASMVST